jgi:hypothetical protein
MGKGMRGWIDLGGDCSWEDYGHTWARKAKDGSWYVLKFENLVEAGGSDFKDTPYECDVKWIDLSEVPTKELVSALQSYGWHISFDIDTGEKAIIDTYSGNFIVKGDCDCDQMLVECCIQYGLGAPLEGFTGKRALVVRAAARRFAEECMKDANMLEKYLARPVNRIGSTAREYGIGNIDAAMHRAPTTKPVKTINPHRCPFFIFMPQHYRDDGSCMCNDANERKRMIAEWEYTEEDFKEKELL